MKKKFLILAIGIIICLIPIVMVCIVSKKEIKQFSIDNRYNLVEKAYGELVSPTRDEVKEYYTVNGEIISETIRFMKIPECIYSEIRWLVGEDDEVFMGQRIGFCNDIDIYASCDGVIKEFLIYEENPTIKVQTFDNLVLKAYISGDNESKMLDIMYDEEGNKFELIKKSRQFTENGIAVTYKLSSNEGYRCGQDVKNFKLYTGQTYSDTLVLDKNCVYRKDDGKNYVRVCDEYGNFINEQEVQVGFECNSYISITGISEGVYCDAGYSYVMNEQNIPVDDSTYIEDVEEH